MAEMSHSAAGKMNSGNDRDKGEGDGPEHLYPTRGIVLRFVIWAHSYSFRCSGGHGAFFFTWSSECTLMGVASEIVLPDKTGAYVS